MRVYLVFSFVFFFLIKNAIGIKCTVNGPMSPMIVPNVSIDCNTYMCSFTYSYQTQMVQRSCHPANDCSVSGGKFSFNIVY